MAKKNQGAQVYLSFKDAATNKFTAANELMIKKLKDLGISLDKVKNSYKVNINETQKYISSINKTSDAVYKMRNRHGDLSKMMERLQYDMSRVRNALLLYYFAYRPLSQIIRTVTTAAQDQERAEQGLYSAIHSTNKVTKTQADLLISLSGKMQELSGIDDTSIIKSEALLARRKLTNSQIERAIPVLVDWTAAKRMSGEQDANIIKTTEMFTRALGGRITTLRTAGIAISEETMRHKTFDNILKDISNTFIDSAKIYGYTYAGSIEKVKQSWGDYIEALGFSITKSHEIRALILVISQAISKHTESLIKANSASDELSQTWNELIASGLFLYNTLILIVNGAKTAGIAIEMAFIKSVEGAIKAIEKIKKVSKDGIFSGLFDEASNESVIKAGKKGNVFSDFFDDIILSIRSKTEIINSESKKPFDNLIFDIDEVNAAIKQRMAELDKDMDLIAENTNKHLSGEFSKDFKENIQEMINDIKTFEDNFGDALNDIEEGSEETFENMYYSAHEFMAAVSMTMRDQFVDQGFKLIKGEMASFEDAFIAMGDILIKKILEIVATEALIGAGLGKYMGYGGGSGLWGGLATIGAALSGGISLGAAASSAQMAGVAATTSAVSGALGPGFHTGGVAKRKKYHSGMLVDEVNATLQTGEGVVSRNGMRSLGADNLARINRGEGGGGTVINNYYVINAIDTESFRERLAQNSDIFQSSVEQGFADNTSLRKTAKRYIS